MAKDVTINEVQVNLAQAMAATAEWDIERPKIAATKLKLEVSEHSKKLLELRVQSLQVIVYFGRSSILVGYNAASTSPL